MNNKTWVDELDEKLQEKIAKMLEENGASDEEITKALNSKVTDVSDIINRIELIDKLEEIE